MAYTRRCSSIDLEDSFLSFGFKLLWNLDNKILALIGSLVLLVFDTSWKALPLFQAPALCCISAPPVPVYSPLFLHCISPLYNPQQRQEMVKRTTIRQRLNKKESKKSADKDVTGASSSSDGSSPQAPVGNVSSLRLKRKVTKKMKFLSKLQENQQILSIKPAIAKRRRRQKKSALHSLSSLADVLPALQGTLTEEKPPYLSKKKQANTRKLVVHETKQLSKVLDHPEFKTNPFTAIQQHLAKTLRGSQMEDTLMKSVTKERSKKRHHKQKKILEL